VLVGHVSESIARSGGAGAPSMPYVGRMEPNQPSGPDPYRQSPEAGGPDRPGAGPSYGYQPAPPFGSPQGQPPSTPQGSYYGPPPGQQPETPQGSYYGPPPGQQPQTPQGSYYGPPPGQQVEPQPSGAVAAPRARTRLALVVALITEIIFIAVFDNQWISEKIAKFEFRTSNSFLAGVASSALTYSWRFSPRTGDTQHLWLSQMMLILAVLVISALLIATVIRGPVTFGRAFFGTWMSVIVATELATIVRGLVIGDAFSRPGTSRLTNAVFGGLGPNAPAFVAGIGLGVVTALVVALVAVTTRRTPVADGAAGPPPPFFGEPPQAPSGSAPWQDRNFGPPSRHPSAGSTAATPPPGDEERTTQFPSLTKDGDAEPTAPPPTTPEPPAQARPTQAPPTQGRPAQPTTGSQRDDQTTQLPRFTGGQQAPGFPRPPDDEDLNPEQH
jgi:hypothetical protein